MFIFSFDANVRSFECRHCHSQLMFNDSTGQALIEAEKAAHLHSHSSPGCAGR